ncbi:MAG TPA: hypothetical protein HA236_05265 [Candidatus Nitrosotenuis sp.]|mgnify:FL=1|jgi:plastocyanin|nr:hypothetical protein [Candidatus Nitrosotenuis sp.]
MAGYYVITTSCVQRNNPNTRTNRLRSKILILVIIAIAVIALAYAISNNQHMSIQKSQNLDPALTVNIVMSASRPGCDKTGCYLPQNLSVNAGDTVTWVNNDRGFHTVTTGFYDTPNGIIESEQIAASDTFSHKFDHSGQFHYYCRLHPWMEGTVSVS